MQFFLEALAEAGYLLKIFGALIVGILAWLAALAAIFAVLWGIARALIWTVKFPFPAHRRLAIAVVWQRWHQGWEDWLERTRKRREKIGAVIVCAMGAVAASAAFWSIALFAAKTPVSLLGGAFLISLPLCTAVWVWYVRDAEIVVPYRVIHVAVVLAFAVLYVTPMLAAFPHMAAFD